MAKQRRIQNPLLLLLGLLVTALLISMLHGAVSITHAQRGDGPTLVVLPNEVALGGEIRLTGYGFIPNDVLDVGLVGGPADSIPLGQVRTDENGNIPPATLLLPDAAEPFDYFVQAQGPANDIPVQTELFMRPAPAITLDPVGGPPGTVVNVTVNDLVPGTLRLGYAGLAVLGPLTVDGNSYSGSFIVPNDRPDPLGEVTTVRAINLVNGLTVGQAEVGFQSEVWRGQPTYQVVNVQLPQGPLENGSTFMIQGQINPPPLGSLDQYDVMATWQSVTGKTFPISLGMAEISADGNFQLPAKLPSLFDGDPTTTQEGDQVGLTVMAPNTLPELASHLGPQPPDGTTLFLKVIAKDTGQVIKGAKIRVVQLGKKTTGTASSLFYGIPNQVAVSLDNTEDDPFTPDEKKAIEDAEKLCDTIVPISINIPNQPGINPAIDPTFESFFSDPLFQNLLEQNAVPLPDLNLSTSDTNETRVAETAGDISYRVFIDAIAQGYGQMENDKPKAISFTVSYHKDSKTYTSPEGSPIPNPLTVPLEKLPEPIFDTPIRNTTYGYKKQKHPTYSV